MPLEIRQLPPMRLAYMRQTGPYGPSLTHLWDRFGRWCEAHGLSEPRPKFYGISLDNPACTPPAQCRYDACVQVGVGLRTGPDAQVQDFPGGDYACFQFVGTGPEIGAAWARMTAPGQIPAGWEVAARPAVEVYDEHFAVNPATGAFPCWLCLAVQRVA
ncbi:GyrI-like domain-containing protein [Acidovorax sp.]|uniref:AraC family transcriptional regulator n=1 Tax=Acidovorax sp. TaxID=1872122 RepID=UPI0025BE54D6|nr:GyrI-like domain-containing protein [Acidovorax sp.]MBW8464690.1 GyrI-like domain-containing protein [Acidovorax sp.]